MGHPPDSLTFRAPNSSGSYVPPITYPVPGTDVCRCNRCPCCGKRVTPTCPPLTTPYPTTFIWDQRYSSSKTPPTPIIRNLTD